MFLYFGVVWSQVQYCQGMNWIAGLVLCAWAPAERLVEIELPEFEAENYYDNGIDESTNKAENTAENTLVDTDLNEDANAVPDSTDATTSDSAVAPEIEPVIAQELKEIIDDAETTLDDATLDDAIKDSTAENTTTVDSSLDAEPVEDPTLVAQDQPHDPETMTSPNVTDDNNDTNHVADTDDSAAKVPVEPVNSQENVDEDNPPTAAEKEEQVVAQDETNNANSDEVQDTDTQTNAVNDDEPVPNPESTTLAADSTLEQQSTDPEQNPVESEAVVVSGDDDTENLTATPALDRDSTTNSPTSDLDSDEPDGDFKPSDDMEDLRLTRRTTMSTSIIDNTISNGCVDERSDIARSEPVHGHFFGSDEEDGLSDSYTPAESDTKSDTATADIQTSADSPVQIMEIVGDKAYRFEIPDCTVAECHVRLLTYIHVL